MILLEPDPPCLAGFRPKSRKLAHACVGRDYSFSLERATGQETSPSWPRPLRPALNEYHRPHSMNHAVGILISLAEALRRVAGVGAAVFPRRWWDRLDDYVPASDSALVSGILTFMAGAALGIVSFVSHATRWAAETNRLVLGSPDLALSGAGSVSMVLGFFTFLFFTP